MLPPEIRLQIWGLLIPFLRTPSHDSESCSRPGWLYIEGDARLYVEGNARSYYRPIFDQHAILRTSARLHDEFSAELYRRELCFCITPECYRWSAKGLPKLLQRDLDWVALDRFKSIQFEIMAPRKQDPLQLIVARDLVVDLVSVIHGFLRRGNRLPKMKIALVETPDSGWVHKGHWNHSIVHGEELDVEYILGPFRVLRNIEAVHVKLPIKKTLRYGLGDEDVHLERFVQGLKSGMMLSDDFGTRESGTYLPKFEHDFDDGTILRHEGRKFFYFLCILRDLHIQRKVNHSKPLWNQKLYLAE